MKPIITEIIETKAKIEAEPHSIAYVSKLSYLSKVARCMGYTETEIDRVIHGTKLKGAERFGC